ncbi:MAG TPA: LysM peptidoglycan-binding domain-containing protein [Opitutaceae bacterium]|jgi:TPR repeat protein/LysM repeat protein|nr:LysM peptidoglycan-binding domain-containing protein [Opitutaceae bacterium]
MTRAAVLFLLGSLAAGVRPLRAAPDVAALRRAADQGDASAQTALGAAYCDGQGVGQNFGQALALFRRAADAHFGPALYDLGLLYEAGRGVPADAAAAFRCYAEAAGLGVATAQFNLGNMYAEGRGVDRDPLQAAIWLRQAAGRGLPEAEYNLGLAYEQGRGMDRDDAQAQRWYRAAWDQGAARAGYNLALLVAAGRGARADLRQAGVIMRAAGLRGLAEAQNDYGVMRATGSDGAPPDLAEAYAWLALAAEGGLPPRNRDAIGRKLSPADRAKADAREADLRAKISGGSGAAKPAAPRTLPLLSAPPPAPPPEKLTLDFGPAGRAEARPLDAIETPPTADSAAAGFFLSGWAAADAGLTQARVEIAAADEKLQGEDQQIADLRRRLEAAVAEASAARTAAEQVQAAPALPPPEAEPAAEPRVYVVQDGDTLTRISLRVYGAVSRWREIYEANRDVLASENALQPGQTLKVP